MAAVILLLVLSAVSVALLLAYAVWLSRKSGRWNKVGSVCALIAAIGIVAVWGCAFLLHHMLFISQ